MSLASIVIVALFGAAIALPLWLYWRAQCETNRLLSHIANLPEKSSKSASAPLMNALIGKVAPYRPVEPGEVQRKVEEQRAAAGQDFSYVLRSDDPTEPDAIVTPLFVE